MKRYVSWWRSVSFWLFLWLGYCRMLLDLKLCYSRALQQVLSDGTRGHSQLFSFSSTQHVNDFQRNVYAKYDGNSTCVYSVTYRDIHVTYCKRTCEAECGRQLFYFQMESWLKLRKFLNLFKKFCFWLNTPFES